MNVDEYAALSDALNSLKVELPEPMECKDDMPLPSFLKSPEKRKLVSLTLKKGRDDQDPLGDGDWTKLDGMVFI